MDTTHTINLIRIKIWHITERKDLLAQQVRERLELIERHRAEKARALENNLSAAEKSQLYKRLRKELRESKLRHKEGWSKLEIRQSEEVKRSETNQT